ncbi:MAG TPA: hypothetical protein VHD91_02020, partial [Gaiellaceae bacterium]|nr:hypothetical protein [Gaiellaceae bacterium]
MRATIGCLFESRSRTGQGAVIADYAFRTIRSVSPAQRLLALSVFAYAVVFLLLIAFGEPGLGVSQGFYLAIVLAALGTDAFVGAAAGATAACLYVAAEAMSGREGWSYVLSAGVSI